MPELRRDPVIGRWVIISSERGRRPTDYHEPPDEERELFCPFCEGNEDKTPPEVMAYRSAGVPNGPGWTLRVVPNKFPALQVEGQLHRRGEGMFDRISGIGAHEVVIETPRHDLQLADLPVEHIQLVFRAFQERIQDLARDIRLRYPMVFKNHGRAAGASLSHSHSQLITLPIVPKRVQEEIDGARSYYNYKERCIFCDIVSQELNDDRRVISHNAGCIAIAPYAPRFPFETWVLPKEHHSRFESSSGDLLRDLAQLIKDVLLRMRVVLEDPPFNFIVHSLPFGSQVGFAYHWHIEIIPVITKVAGFEWGTGFYINPTPPEVSTRFMREADLTGG
ncbi:galactose-1-phosphate uridylyltransferase [bacterium]|nr:galactose-1-phosphate uridylyltransferase [candidate division CSSED10-310 bacterium]